MRISAIRHLILIQLPIIILAHPREPSNPLISHGNDPAKGAVAGVPSILPSISSEAQHPSDSSSFFLPRSISDSHARMSFPVKGTPVRLTITLGYPLIPQIYISAGLTAALRNIAPNVAAGRHDRIPGNRFSYRDRTSGVALEYIGFIDLYWLTWEQLSWTLSGLLQFVEWREENSKALSAWVFIRDGTYLAKPYGSVTLDYNGGRVA